MRSYYILFYNITFYEVILFYIISIYVVSHVWHMLHPSGHSRPGLRTIRERPRFLAPPEIFGPIVVCFAFSMRCLYGSRILFAA